MIEEIRRSVHEAAGSNQKIAMFHYQVLVNAEALRNEDPEGFCEELAVPRSYAAEFRKMLGLSRLMAEQGASLQR